MFYGKPPPLSHTSAGTLIIIGWATIKIFCKPYNNIHSCVAFVLFLHYFHGLESTSDEILSVY